MANNEWPRDMLEESMRKIEKLPVVLYGAGKYGRQALWNIRTYFKTVNVRYFIDDDKVRNNEAVDGIELLYLSEAIEKLGKEFNIIITNYYLPQVLKKIEINKFDLDKVYFFNELLIEDVESLVVGEYREQMKKVYGLLEDYKSKMIYRTMAESRITKNINILAHTCEENQYFPLNDIFEMGEEEVFVDAGAFDGDTVQQFIELTNGRFKKIYAFEPDKSNYKKILNRQYGEKVKIFNGGLYDVTTEIAFLGDKGGSSKIEMGGNETISIYQFDSIDEVDEKVTFIKMDIEGSERKALEGMKKTICRDKPKLAICIYHKYEDLWEIPLYIKELVPEYKIFIRNYTTYLDEIVLYAVV